MNFILAPLVEAQVPEALWLKCSLSKTPGESIAEEEFDRLYGAEVRKTAEAGSMEAKFALACELDYDNDSVDESSALFREDALADHAYSQ